MPTFRGTTKQSRESWKSDDGKVTAYELIIDANGADMRVQTYSKAISQIGWTGEFETYEKNGRTFAKQPQKERSFGGGGGAKVPQDQFTMYLSYAKDLAIAALKDGKFDGAFYGELLDNVLLGGKTLYDGRPGNETEEKTDDPVVEPLDDPWAGIDAQ